MQWNEGNGTRTRPAERRKWNERLRGKSTWCCARLSWQSSSRSRYQSLRNSRLSCLSLKSCRRALLAKTERIFGSDSKDYIVICFVAELASLLSWLFIFFELLHWRLSAFGRWSKMDTYKEAIVENLHVLQKLYWLIDWLIEKFSLK